MIGRERRHDRGRASRSERGVVVVDDAGDSPIARALGWRSFVLAAVVLRDETVARAARRAATGAPLGAFDGELVGRSRRG